MFQNRDCGHILCVGPLMMNRILFSADRTCILCPAGNGLIFSAVAARLGRNVTVGARVGDDGYGVDIVQSLQRWGADTSRVSALVGLPTKVATVVIGADGEWKRRSTNMDLFPYVDSAYIDAISDFDSGTALHFAGINSLLRSGPRATDRLIRLARKRGCRVSFGLTISPSDPALLTNLIEPDDILFCTSNEFSALTGIKCPDARSVAESLLGSRFRNCIVTAGKDGAIVRWSGQALYSVRPVGPQARNSLGAGDAFSSVMMSALFAQYPVSEALGLASVAAGSLVGHRTWTQWLDSTLSLGQLELVYRREEATDALVRAL